ncbi:DUF3379 family protein [Dokdonella sp.]|uniref:DUF3379 family protein n=1 Tax=Dokdonella sp. TaxID=2291710 RepID=UPI002F404E0B
MDCLEFRRRLGSDPQVLDTGARAHMASCRDCAPLAAEAQAFDARLAAALAVPVPDDLVERILQAQRRRTVEPFQPRRRLGWIALAAAASVLLAFGVVRLRQATGLRAMVAAHVTAPDEHAALAMVAPVPQAEVEHAFADRGVKLADVPPEVAYVAECSIGRWRSVHMVSAGTDGPVSVVYVVRDRASKASSFHRAGLVAREVPMADGTLFMLADSDARFDALEHAWRNALEGLPRVASGSN